MLSFQQKTDAVFIRATILPFVLKIDHFKLQTLVPPPPVSAWYHL